MTALASPALTALAADGLVGNGPHFRHGLGDAPSKVNQVPDLDTIDLQLSDLQLVTKQEKGCTKRHFVNVDGQDFIATPRFRSSILGVIGQSDSIFNLFPFEEVIERFKDKFPARMNTRLTLDRTSNKALGIVNEKKTIVGYRDLIKAIEANTKDGGPHFIYEEGKILSRHNPTVGFERDARELAGDAQEFKFYGDFPIDGFGSPGLFIGILRQICSNGAIAMTHAFRKQVNLPSSDKGEVDIMSILSRVLSTFSVGDKASNALVERYETARNTPASLSEFRGFCNTVDKLQQGDGSALHLARLQSRVARLREDVCTDLEIGCLTAFDEKPGQRIPTRWSVYDLVNMASEAATHFDVTKYPLHGFIGTKITSNYDLEGLDMPVAGEAQPFYLLNDKEQSALVSLN